MRSRPEGVGIIVPLLGIAGRFMPFFPILDAVSTDAPSAGAPTGNLWDLVLGILIFVALIAGALIMIRVMSGKGFGRQGRHFRVLDRFPVSRDCFILLLAVGSRVLAVCVGRDGGSLLCELDPQELDGSASDTVVKARPKAGAENTEASFLQRFGHNMKLNMGVLPKDAAPMRPASKTSPPSVKRDTDFSAILQAIQQRDTQGAPSSRPASADPAADYRAAVENMHRLAQTEAPAVRPASARTSQKTDPDQTAVVRSDSAHKAPARKGSDWKDPDVTGPDRAGTAVEAQSSDEETARELLRMLQSRKASAKPHDPPKSAYAKDVSPGSEPDGQIDEILDKIAQRQSRYASQKSKPKSGGRNRKEGT